MEERRPRAFAVAYRMLGSVSEAEDIVQEALVRRHHLLQQGEPIESPRASHEVLSTVVTPAVHPPAAIRSGARATSANGCPSRWSTKLSQNMRPITLGLPSPEGRGRSAVPGARRRGPSRPDGVVNR